MLKTHQCFKPPVETQAPPVTFNGCRGDLGGIGRFLRSPEIEALNVACLGTRPGGSSSWRGKHHKQQEQREEEGRQKG